MAGLVSPVSSVCTVSFDRLGEGIGRCGRVYSKRVIALDLRTAVTLRAAPMNYSLSFLLRSANGIRAVASV